MTRPPQFRAAGFACLVAALALFTAGALAQAPDAKAPIPSPPAKEAAEAPPPPSAKRQAQAKNAYFAGARLLDHKDLAGAEAQFAKAMTLDPARAEYSLAFALAHEHRVTDLIQQSGKARLLGQNARAEALLAEARKLDPENTIVTQHVDALAPVSLFKPQAEPWITQGPVLAGPITLLPNSGPQSFHLHSDVQNVIRQVLTGYGIQPVFDESVRGQSIRFDLDDAPYQQAATVLLGLTGLFAVPLESRSLLIAKDTPENRQRLERQLEETIYVPGLTTEQMGELGNIIRNVFEIRQATVQNAGGNIAIRAPEETVKALNLTLADLIDGGSQVTLDLKLYSVDRTHQRNIGIQLPQQIGLYSASSAAHDIVINNQSLVNQAIAQGLIPPDANEITIALALIASGLVQSTLFTNTIGFFGGGKTLTGLTSTPNVTLNLGLNSSDTRALDNILLRVGDRQAATFRVGTRYPITTSTYTSGVSANQAQLAGVNINGIPAASLLANLTSVTIPQIQYEDLGLILKATPTVQTSGQISIHLDLKIQALAGVALNNIPILANRQYVSDVTVADGESALLLSTLSNTESAAVSGLPGLGELPGFQTATADKVSSRDTSELVLLITPRIVRRRPHINAGPRIALNSPQQSN